jgi:NADH-quinone oxidoreductase subunit G
VHPQDAVALDLESGCVARLSVESGGATLPVETSAKVAPGTVYIEGGHAATAPLGAGRVEIGRA